MSFTHALKWSFLSELAAKAIQPVVFIVLARLLTPEDFGVMTAAMMVIAFSQIFWEAGMGKALIQRQTHVAEAANVAFMINIGLGVLIAGLLYLFAQPIAHTFFQDERVTAVLQVMTLQVLLGALGSVQTALLQKEMGFKKLFWVRFATVSLPGLASIPLAWNGWGYWALVAGTLAGQFAQVITLWRMSLWRPGFTRDSMVTNEIVRFGGWVGISGLLTWFYVWVDALIVGMFLGSHDLGLYRTGSQFSIMVFALIFGPFAPVLYSQLSKIGKDQDRMRVVVQSYIKVITTISIPIAFMIMAINDYIESYVFGESWVGIGHVLGIMALVHGISYMTSMNTEAYRASGRPHYETLVMFLPLPIYLAVYFYIAPMGLDAFLLGRLALVLIVATSINLYLVKRLFKVPSLPIISFFAFVAVTSLVWFVSDYYFGQLIHPKWLGGLVTMLIGLVAVAMIIFMAYRKQILFSLNTLIEPCINA